MTSRVLLMISRIFEGTGTVTATPDGDARHHGHPDFMVHDLSAGETSERL
jgi:hypothetical protein